MEGGPEAETGQTQTKRKDGNCLIDLDVLASFLRIYIPREHAWKGDRGELQVDQTVFIAKGGMKNWKRVRVDRRTYQGGGPKYFEGWMCDLFELGLRRGCFLGFTETNLLTWKPQAKNE